MNARTGVVVLSSEQQIPNLECFFQLRPAATALFIYHTSDEKRSRGPALRLQALVKDQWPDVQVHLEPGGIAPQDVRQQVLRWIEEHPELDHWVVNATGGLKLMFAGAIDLVDIPRCEVRYREQGQGWFRLVRDAGKLLSVQLPSEQTPGLQIEAIKLIELQYSTPVGARWSHQDARPLDVEAITRSGCLTQWDWPASFKEAGNPSGGNPGILFEKYVAAACLELGIPDVHINLELMPETGARMMEIDVFFRKEEKIVFIDCKLKHAGSASNSPSMIIQIQQAITRRRELGGLAADYLMIRPADEVDEGVKGLARIGQVELWTQADMPRLFSKLAERLAPGVPLPSALGTAEELLEQHRSGGGHCFFRSRHQPSLSVFKDSMAPIFNLDDHALEIEGTDRPWVAYMISNIWFFVHHRMEDGKPGHERVKKALCRFGNVVERQAKNHSMFGVACRNSEEFKGFLKRHVGKPLTGS